MTTSANDDLYEQIRAKCQREHWYGGDLLSPKNLLVSEQDASRFGFSFPPASEIQLRRTEEMLGFALPPSLRELYMHVANGGFGPGAGLPASVDADRMALVLDKERFANGLRGAINLAAPYSAGQRRYRG